MTRLEMQTRLKQALGNRASTVGVTIDDTWYNDRLLEGYQALLTMQGPTTGPSRGGGMYRRVLRFPEMETRVSTSLDIDTDNFVANASGTLLVLDIFDRDHDRPVSRPSEHNFKLRDPDETGIPREWYPAYEAGVSGIRVWPYPSTADEEIDVYLDVVTDPETTFTSDSSVPRIEPVWHMAIVYKAAELGADLLEWPERAQEMSGKFDNYVARQLSRHEQQSRTAVGSQMRYIQVGGR